MDKRKVGMCIITQKTIGEYQVLSITGDYCPDAMPRFNCWVNLGVSYVHGNKFQLKSLDLSFDYGWMVLGEGIEFVENKPARAWGNWKDKRPVGDNYLVDCGHSVLYKEMIRQIPRSEPVMSFLEGLVR